MRYIAIKPIGEYKIGDEIPEEKATVWMDMYAEPHVKIAGESSGKIDKKLKKSDKEGLDFKKSSKSSDVMLEDYLGRNENVVIKNVKEDNLSKDHLEKLLKLEVSDKKRKSVIEAINKKLVSIK